MSELTQWELWNTQCHISTTHHPWFLLLKQLNHIQMPLLFIVTVHIMFVPLIPQLGLLQEAGLLLHNVLKGYKTQTKMKTPRLVWNAAFTFKYYKKSKYNRNLNNQWCSCDLTILPLRSKWDATHKQNCTSCCSWSAVYCMSKLYVHLQFSFSVAKVFELTVVFIHLWWSHWLLSCLEQLNFGHLRELAHFLLWGQTNHINRK